MQPHAKWGKLLSMPKSALREGLVARLGDCHAVGCIMGELLKHAPLFPGRTEIAMLDLFTKLLGNPHAGIWHVRRRKPPLSIEP